jgi:hypothetical protein
MVFIAPCCSAVTLSPERFLPPLSAEATPVAMA